MKPEDRAKCPCSRCPREATCPKTEKYVCGACCCPCD